MGTSHDSATHEQHVTREKAYLEAIAAELATGDNPIATRMDEVGHSGGIPMLVLPGPDGDDDEILTVWANWEATDEHAHEFNIMRDPFDDFPVLPDGHEPGDAAEAACIVREYIATRVDT